MPKKPEFNQHDPVINALLKSPPFIKLTQLVKNFDIGERMNFIRYIQSRISKAIWDKEESYKEVPGEFRARRE